MPAGLSADAIDTVIRTIEAAFASVPRGAVSLHEAEAIDDYATAAERRKARSRDPEQDWRLVPDAAIEACADALPHLDPVSWRFYLPAFMRSGLRRLDAPGCVVDRAIYSLDLGEDPELFEYIRARFATLDAEQTRAVRAFLELAAASEPCCDATVAEQALERYWRLDPNQAIGD